MKVPFVNIGLQYKFLKDEIISKLDQILSQGEYILGKELEMFESEFSIFCGTKFAVGVGSGTDALFLSLKALNIREGDEVIIPGNAFVSTASIVANAKARPVFVDVLDDFNIDPSKVEAAITENTKAIIPVHLTGRIANMNEINKIAQVHNLHVFEDAAQAIGASMMNKKSGAFGLTGCFSLHPLKNLHIYGDGGVVTTNNKKIYESIKKLRNHGFKNRNECEFWGYNSRLDNIQAAIARIKLQHIDKINNKFIEISKIYSKELKNIISVPDDDKKRKSVFHRYIIQHPSRNRLKKFLEENGIETKINYPIPLHLQQSASSLGYKIGDLPNVEKQSKLILSLPIYAEMEDDQIYYVIEKVKKFNK